MKQSRPWFVYYALPLDEIGSELRVNTITKRTRSHGIPPCPLLNSELLQGSMTKYDGLSSDWISRNNTSYARGRMA